MGKAGKNEIRIVGGRSNALQRSPSQDVMPNQGHKHGVLNVVIECIAIPNALQG